MSRADIIGGVRLLGGRAPEKCRAMDDGVDPTYGGCQGVGLEQVAFDEVYPIFAQVSGARLIAHEGVNMSAALGQSFDEAAADFSGGSGHEDFHALKIAVGASLELDETDMSVDACVPVMRVASIASCTGAS
jgi:hypothetical protein